ncbi:DMT family transporter [Campylobacter sp. CCUG 57310]|uniref:DMT family transporter n=1 Tax=Campylobacter sp. CCUG 57310 TaxID=2517362 RepID=UPI001566CDF2|nr:DMT family transporter [Campylobacter sp. CCUG 57310]QKF92822.1 putative membrane protein [Campylobacter sp. CCUG 57310]
MKSFEDLVNEKQCVIKECKNFIENIRNFYKSDENIPNNASILMDLIYQKIKIYESISCSNYDETIKSIEDINEKIYKQIYILKNEIWNDFKANLKIIKEKYNIENTNTEKLLNQNLEDKRNQIINNEYFNMYLKNKSEAIKLKIINKNIKLVLTNKIAKALILSATGIITFWLYFWINIGYTPPIQEMLEMIIPVSVMQITIATLIFIVMIMFSYWYVSERNSGKFINSTFIYYKSLFIPIFSILLGIFIALMYKNWISFILTSSVIYILTTIFIKYRKKDLSVIICTSILCLAIFIFSMIASSKFNMPDKWLSIFLLLYSFMLIWIIVVSNETKEKEIEIVFLTTVLIITSSISFFSFDFIIQKINAGNINYKFISIDKKALNSLPDGICRENCEEHFCINNTKGIYACENINITAISYIDGNFTYKNNDTNITKSIEKVSGKCFKFLDENQTIIDIPKESELNFKDQILIIKKDKNTKKEYRNVSLKSDPKICMTYIKNQDNHTFKIYNIKALSTLGNFYLLKTIDGKIFEIDLNLIISKEKE